MEIISNLSERVLGHLALQIAELVDTAALHCGSSPHLADGSAQAGIAIDDRQDRGPQAARDEIVETALPRRERLTAAQLESKQMLLPIGQDADGTEDGHAHDPSGTAYTQGKAVELNVITSSSASERRRHASRPSYSVAMTRETALLDRGAALSSGWSAPRIRRVFPPARYVATMASLTCGIRW